MLCLEWYCWDQETQGKNTVNCSVTFRKQKLGDFDVKRKRTQKWWASDVPHDVQILDAFQHIHKLFLQ